MSDGNKWKLMSGKSGNFCTNDRSQCHMRSGYLITRVFHAIRLVAEIYSNSNMDFCSFTFFFFLITFKSSMKKSIFAFFPVRRRRRSSSCSNDFFRMQFFTIIIRKKEEMRNWLRILIMSLLWVQLNSSQACTHIIIIECLADRKNRNFITHSRKSLNLIKCQK